MRMNKALLVLALLAPFSFRAADLPEAVLPAGVGVNIHFTRGHESDLDRIAAGGFKFIRMDFGWGGIERQKGEYNWKDYDELTANLERRGLRAIYILDYSNPLYEETLVSRDPITGRESRATAAPQHPESVAAFARWAAAAAKHFQGRRIIWEIWNEPNIFFWQPKPNVAQYTELALATCRAVREADPQATIIAPASSEFPWEFLEKLCQAGLLDYLDALSVHPYRSYSRGPETAAADYLRLRALIARYAPAAKRHLPIISGEWGYATQSKSGVTLETQAAFVARQQLANLLQGVPLSIWYDWKNDGPDPAYNEHNFGTVLADLTPKPAYRAVQTLTRELQDCRIVRRLAMGGEEDYVVLCTNRQGLQKLAVWTTGQPHALQLEVDLATADQLAWVNGDGQPQTAQLEQGRPRLSLVAAPQYLTFRQPNRALTLETAWAFSDQFVPVLGSQDGEAMLRLVVRNPLQEPVQATVEITDGPAANRSSAVLEPGQSREFRLSYAQARRDTERVAVPFGVQLAATTGERKLLRSWREQVTVAVLHPLTLSVAPVRSGMRLLVHNPTGAAFAGQVMPGQFPLALKAGETEASLPLPTHGAPDRLRPLVRLLANDALVAQVETPRFQPLAVPSFRAALDGDAKVPAKASLVVTNLPGEESPFSRAFRLDYQFEKGWRFVRCVPSGTAAVKLEPRPAALGLWVQGDNSGNLLRLRVTDQEGQTFQPNGPALNWIGWRWVVFDLKDLRQAGHWGGPNDGVVHGALRLDCPLLLDGSSRPTAGSIRFTAPVLVLE